MSENLIHCCLHTHTNTEDYNRYTQKYVMLFQLNTSVWFHSPLKGWYEHSMSTHFATLHVMSWTKKEAAECETDALCFINFIHLFVCSSAWNLSRLYSSALEQKKQHKSSSCKNCLDETKDAIQKQHEVSLCHHRWFIAAVPPCLSPPLFYTLLSVSS